MVNWSSGYKFLSRMLIQLLIRFQLQGFEMIRGVVVEPVPFDIERGLVTPTMKKKRSQMLKCYQVLTNTVNEFMMQATVKSINKQTQISFFIYCFCWSWRFTLSLCSSLTMLSWIYDALKSGLIMWRWRLIKFTKG